MNEGRPVRKEAIQRGLQVGYLECEPNLPTDATANFNLVDRTSLRFVKDLESGLA